MNEKTFEIKNVLSYSTRGVPFGLRMGRDMVILDVLLGCRIFQFYAFFLSLLRALGDLCMVHTDMRCDKQISGYGTVSLTWSYLSAHESI